MILPRRTSVAHGSLSSGVVCAVLGVLAAGCNRQLPPAPTPQMVAPAIALETGLAQGEGQLVVDVVDGPTQVMRIRMLPSQVIDSQGRKRYQFNEDAEVLCAATPCVVKQRVGPLVLGFPVLGNPGSMEVELVHVDQQASVYRRALSFHDPVKSGPGRTLGIVGTALGGTAVVAGAALLPIGLSKDKSGLTLAGSITLGAGAALTALGIWALSGTSSSYRPGSAIHF